MTFLAADDAPVRLAEVRLDGGTRLPGDAGSAEVASTRHAFDLQGLVELQLAGSGRARSSERAVGTAAGRRLRYVDHASIRDTYSIVQAGEADGLVVTSWFRLAGTAVLAWTVVENVGATPVVVEAVSSFAFAPGGGDDGFQVDHTTLTAAASEWLAEGRWLTTPLRDLVPEIDLPLHRQDPRGGLRRSSFGSWPTGRYLPGGVLVDDAAGLTIAWDIAHNGGWMWEVGERQTGLYVAAFGPTDAEHDWSKRLAPGQSFESVPVIVGFGGAGLSSGAAALLSARRALRPPHADQVTLPIVFNDFMNTVMGDPTAEKLLPLIRAVAAVGAEIFVIDAGWYDDDSNWWDAVGDWRESTTRFPDGLGSLFDEMRSLGLRPGLWLEPEVCGVRSPLAQRLPDEAFLMRHGARVRENDRFHLDLRHPAAVAHLDAVIDRLVAEYGIEYFKLDYNINAGPGTEVAGCSAGEGLLQANRAQLRWVEGVLARHPQLTLENCSSGGMRADAASLQRFQLQSTSDQQNAVLYAPVAASAPMSIAPEQAANWAYPQPGMRREEQIFTLVTSMLGRLYLSGFLDSMSADETELVREAIAAHRSIRHEVAIATPFWPIGLPGWSDPAVALGLRTPRRDLLSVWWRADDPTPIALAIPEAAGRTIEITPVFPATLAGWRHAWDADTAVLTMTPPAGGPSARTFAVIRGALR